MKLLLQNRNLVLLTRLIMLAAIFSLGLLGGSYSHAHPVEHSQSGTSGLDEKHDHFDLPKSKTDTPSGIHCGGDIFDNEYCRIVEYRKSSKTMNVALLSLATGLQIGEDPPPPRRNSRLN